MTTPRDTMSDGTDVYVWQDSQATLWPLISPAGWYCTACEHRVDAPSRHSWSPPHLSRMRELAMQPARKARNGA